MGDERLLGLRPLQAAERRAVPEGPRALALVEVAGAAGAADRARDLEAAQHAVADRHRADRVARGEDGPTYSWPIVKPGSMATRPWKMCRSLPHTPVASMRTIASSGRLQLGVGALVDAHLARRLEGDGVHQGGTLTLPRRARSLAAGCPLPSRTRPRPRRCGGGRSARSPSTSACCAAGATSACSSSGRPSRSSARWPPSSAMPFQAYELTGSSLAVGLLGVAEFAPILVLALVGGALADAFDRRRLVQIAEVGAAVVAGALLVNATLADPHSGCSTSARRSRRASRRCAARRSTRSCRAWWSATSSRRRRRCSSAPQHGGAGRPGDRRAAHRRRRADRHLRRRRRQLRGLARRR